MCEGTRRTKAELTGKWTILFEFLFEFLFESCSKRSFQQSF